MVFYIPATVPGKVTIGVSILMANAVLLLVVSSILPVQSNVTPALGRWLHLSQHLKIGDTIKVIYAIISP